MAGEGAIADADAVLHDAEEREFELRTAFRRFDTNSNGVIEASECEGLLVELLDDGDVSEEELRMFFDEQYSASDINRDGVLEFSEFARFYNALIAFVARLKEKRGSGGGAAGREAEEAAKKAAEEYEAEVKARREADESKKEAAAAEDAAGLPDGGCWPVWYNDELRDAGTIQAMLEPLWEKLHKDEEGRVNIHDLIGELYKFYTKHPNIARRLGEDVRSAEEFEGVPYYDINFTLPILVRQFREAAKAEARDFWIRSVKGELFESEEKEVA